MAMAGMDSNRNTSIVNELYSRLDELSQAISPRVTSQIESEVSRVFTGGRSRGIGTNTAVPSVRVNPTQTNGLGSSTSIEENSSGNGSRLPFPTQRAFGIRRHFPGQRPAQRPASRRRGQRTSSVDNKPFMRDLILLSGPNDTVVPRQGARLALMENGHVITGCKFTKGQSDTEVETTIMIAFEGKIPEVGVDIELLTSMHTTLVKPSLAPGQNGIDGTILQRLYKNKPVYIRPDHQLLPSQTRPMYQVTFSSIVLKYQQNC